MSHLFVVETEALDASCLLLVLSEVSHFRRRNQEEGLCDVDCGVHWRDHGMLVWLLLLLFLFLFFFFFKQKTAYEIGTGDWSSDVCSSDLYCRCC